MAERWKYQIKFGCFWAFMMIAFMLLFEWREQPIMEQLSTRRFYFRVVMDFFFGIFVMGYLFWKGKDQNNNKWSTFFGKKKR